MVRRWIVVALAALVVCVACTSSPSAETGPSPSRETPSPTGSVSPTQAPVSPEGVPVPATPPAGIVATTTQGDVMVIELPTRAVTTIARYAPRSGGGERQTFFLSAVTITPEERILLSSCCEPAGGAVMTVSFAGRESDRPPLTGDDPELDPTGRLVVRGEIGGLSIAPITRRAIGEATFLTDGRAGYFGQDPGWSPDSSRIAFTIKGRLYVIAASSTSIRGLDPIHSGRGSYWGPLAWTATGLLVAEIDGRWDEQGPSRIVRVDPDAKTRTVLWRSPRTITDLASSRVPTDYLWVAGGTLHWNVGGVEGSLDGSFEKAAFFPG